MNEVQGFTERWANEFSDPYVSKHLYTSLVRPILKYGPIVWDPQYGIYVNKIESVQKQVLLFSSRHFNLNSNFISPPG